MFIPVLDLSYCKFQDFKATIVDPNEVDHYEPPHLDSTLFLYMYSKHLIGNASVIKGYHFYYIMMHTLLPETGQTLPFFCYHQS